jgi:hypothetical protein
LALQGLPKPADSLVLADAPLPPRKAPEPVGNRTALDLDEFGRLLSTGKAEDLKKIARDLGWQEAVPEARR